MISLVRFAAQPWPAVSALTGYAWRTPYPRASVLLQHGYAEYAGRYVEHYARLVPSLNARQFSVFAFDMAGHGLSPGERGLVDVSAMVAVHARARRALAGEGRPLFLFGHSLGGLVTAASVAREPGGVAGVVLSGPALPRPLPLTRAAVRLLAKVAPGFGVGKLGPPNGISRIGREVEEYVRDPLVFKRPIPALLGASAVAEAAHIFRHADGWTAPTLIIHGTADSYAPPKPAQRLFAGIGSRDKTMHLVPGGRHELLNDEGGEAMLATVLDWIEARVAQPGGIPKM